MLFSNYEFLLFFPIVIGLFFALPPRWRCPLVLAASYVFYMWWRIDYALLLVVSTIVDYIVGLRMGQLDTRSARFKYLLLSLSVNLGLLFTFKYFGFFRESVGAAARLAGGDLALPALDVLLPVGISFYTFQTLSYTIEVYRGKVRPERNLPRFALYVSFFPQLVAGPIERPQRLLPQLSLAHGFDYARVADGLKLIAWGLFKKVAIADRLALVVDRVYANPAEFGGVHLSIATICFAYQIYYDFSGYSDIAIGAAKVMGVDLMTNFDRPYAARSIPEFWRRWHISLSTWFRDYIYIPLGGRRVSIPRWYVNLIIVFVVSGLWHGAAWTFVIWGAIHGIYMVVSAATARAREALARRIGISGRPRLHAAFQRGVTFAMVCLAWIFFRAEGFSDAVSIIGRLHTGWGELLSGGVAAFESAAAALGPYARHVPIGLVLAALVERVSYLERGNATRSLMTDRPAALRWAFYVLLIVGLLNLGVSQEIPFIYFQF